MKLLDDTGGKMKNLEEKVKEQLKYIEDKKKENKSVDVKIKIEDIKIVIEGVNIEKQIYKVKK